MDNWFTSRKTVVGLGFSSTTCWCPLSSRWLSEINTLRTSPTSHDEVHVASTRLEKETPLPVTFYGTRSRLQSQSPLGDLAVFFRGYSLHDICGNTWWTTSSFWLATELMMWHHTNPHETRRCQQRWIVLFRLHPHLGNHRRMNTTLRDGFRTRQFGWRGVRDVGTAVWRLEGSRSLSEADVDFWLGRWPWWRCTAVTSSSPSLGLPCPMSIGWPQSFASCLYDVHSSWRARGGGCDRSGISVKYVSHRSVFFNAVCHDLCELWTFDQLVSTSTLLRYHVWWQVSDCFCFWEHVSLKVCLFVGRESYRGACCGPPTAFLVRHRCTVGVLAGTHRCATESRVTLWQSANPSWCGCWCCWSRDVVCSLRSRSTLMCNWEYLHPCSTGSAVLALSRHHSQASPPNFSGLWVFSSMEFFANKSCLTRSSSRYLVRDGIAFFLLAGCSIAIHLVHTNANLFLFFGRSINFGLSFPSLGLTASFATEDTLYFVSAMLWASSTVVRVPSFERNWSVPTRAAVFPHETSVICSVVRNAWRTFSQQLAAGGCRRWKKVNKKQSESGQREVLGEWRE